VALRFQKRLDGHVIRDVVGAGRECEQKKRDCQAAVSRGT
jgi:hypothetical protein